MAITKLMHIKESPSVPYTHLRNAINYILDVRNNGEKTGYGQYVGGNAGSDHREILQNFLITKKDFGKEDGRQGYHFVISFAPGETDERTAFAVAQEFCDAYLGDNYDYVSALHLDKKHLHVHIVFNSVSRMDGRKYHYCKGDWEKYIQPITDRVCEEHGLMPLTYEEERVGVSYASWAEKQKGKINWSHIIRADVDYAVRQSNTFEEFKAVMKKMNYQIRFGHSRKRDANYFTYVFTGDDGKEHRRRSYNLPPGYHPEEIMQRIQAGEGSRSYEKIMGQIQHKAYIYLEKSVSFRSTQTYKRLYQAASYYQLPNPYAVPSYRVRKDMLHIDRLLEECRYLKDHRITDKERLVKEGAFLKRQINDLSRERKKLYGILDATDSKEKKEMEHYQALQSSLNKAFQEGNDAFEKIEDELKKLERMLPHDLLEIKGKIDDCNHQLAAARKDLRIWKRICLTEGNQPLESPGLALAKKI